MNEIAVIGSGTMGVGIAEVAARAGYQVTLVDVSVELAEKGLTKISQSLERAEKKGKIDHAEAEAAFNRIRLATEVEQEPEWVIEAVPENLGLKQKILSSLAGRFDNVLLGSNTSSLSLSEIAKACDKPERVIGLHFFNPAPVMALVEIVRAEQSSQGTVDAALALVEKLGKQPIVVKDAPGFATSRLGIALGMEAIRLLEAKIASAADIDRAMELGYRHPMGPLKLTDLVGLDVRLAIAEHLRRELGPQFEPPQLLKDMVAAKKLGKKSGEGFYRWENGQAIEKDTP